jgi:hypothetical protein
MNPGAQSKPIEYHLEIHNPGGNLESAALGAMLISPTPFPAIAVGDVISPNGFQSLGDNTAGHLQVTGVRHIIWEAADHNSHKVCVFTRRLDVAERDQFGA